MCIHTTSYHLRLEFSISAKRNSQNFIMMSSLLLDFHMVLIYLYSARDIPLCCMQYSNLHIWLLLKTIGRLWKNLAIILQAKSSKQQWFHSRFLGKFLKKKPEFWTVFFVIFQNQWDSYRKIILKSINFWNNDFPSAQMLHHFSIFNSLQNWNVSLLPG